MRRPSTIIIIGLGIVSLIYLGFTLIQDSRKKRLGLRNIIVGDSQTPLIAKQTTKAQLLGQSGGENVLWKGSMGLKWLKDAVSKYPVTNDVGGVIINIGTNGGFNPLDDVSGLVRELRRVFPNAKLYAVQGSWGWGGNQDVTGAQVKAYYDRFRAEGVKVLNPPIGSTSNPHSSLPIYKDIGRSIDAEL